MVPIVGMIVSFIALIGFSGWYYVDKTKSSEIPRPIIPMLRKPLTLRNLFDTDFSNNYLPFSTTADLELNDGTTPIGVKRSMPWKALGDREGRSSFLSFFIEANPGDIRRTISQCKFVADHYLDFLNESKNSIEYLSPNPGESVVISVKDLTFSGQIYLYIPDFLTIEQQYAIQQMFKAQNLSVIIRGEVYRKEHFQEDRVAYLSSDWG